jgi:hypothetical protein
MPRSRRSSASGRSLLARRGLTRFVAGRTAAVPWLVLASFLSALVFVRVPAPETDYTSAPAVALYIDGIDSLGPQDLHVTARLQAPVVGVTGCGRDVRVTLEISPSRAFWRRYGPGLTKRRFALVVAGATPGSAVYPGPQDVEPIPFREADEFHAAAVDRDLPTRHRFRPDAAFEAAFSVPWARRRGFGLCVVQMPSLSGLAAFKTWAVGRNLLDPPSGGNHGGRGIGGLNPPATVGFSVLSPPSGAAWQLDEAETTPAPQQTRPAVWSCRADAPPDVLADCDAEATLVAPWLGTARDVLLLVIGTLIGIVFEIVRKPGRSSRTGKPTG